MKREDYRRVHRGDWGFSAACERGIFSVFQAFWGQRAFLRADKASLRSAGCMWISSVCVRQVPDQCRKQQGWRRWPEILSTLCQCQPTLFRGKKQSLTNQHSKEVFPTKTTPKDEGGTDLEKFVLLVPRCLFSSKTFTIQTWSTLFVLKVMTFELTPCQMPGSNLTSNLCLLFGLDAGNITIYIFNLYYLLHLTLAK